MKYYDYDVAIIMKKVEYKSGMMGFIPVKVVEGYYDETEMCFVDFDGTPYYHIIDEPESYGYFERENFNELKKLYPYLNSNIIKLRKLVKAKTSEYVYLDEESTDVGVPIIGEYVKKDNNIQQIFDGDMINYYYNNYPDYFSTVYGIDIDNEKQVNENKQISYSEKTLDINEMYNEIVSRVIGQDDAIKEILEVIFDQLEKEDDEKIDNILINGDTGVGKTEIFRILTKILNIPCVITAATQYSATGYKGGDVEDMLVSLVKKANGDINKAQRGILIIDEIDKISETNKSQSQPNQKDVQDAILKILEDGVIPIEVGDVEYEFDCSKLMVIGMGSWTRVELNQEKTIGFGKKEVPKKTYKDFTSQDMVNNGMSRDLIGRFDVIIQMNNLGLDDYIKILKSKYNLLEQHKKRLANKGVNMHVSDDVLKAIATKASKSMFGARDLRKIIEKALTKAKYEIRSNPDKYSELIITEDTIEDNNKYTLIEKAEEKKLYKKID